MKPSASTILETEFGRFNCSVYVGENNNEHVALQQGAIAKNEPVLVRIQSECITGEVFHSLMCDCGPQLDEAMKKINDVGQGLIIYLRQEGRDIGLTNKIKAYELQRQGLDTIEANEKLGFPPDARTYEVAAVILKNLGVDKIRLLTNSPDKIAKLEALGLDVVERIPLEIPPNGYDNQYLETKRTKMGHLLTL